MKLRVKGARNGRRKTNHESNGFRSPAKSSLSDIQYLCLALSKFLRCLAHSVELSSTRSTGIVDQSIM